MTPEWILERFAHPNPEPRRFDPGRDSIHSYRGDHSLNPDMYPVVKADGSLRAAAVLVPLVVRPEGIHVLLTVRTDHLHHHPGQISFPGGRVEDEDDSLEHTALREAQEEIGLPPEAVHIVGHLDDYITRTGFVVSPIVALLKPPFPLHPDPSEVAEVFEVPLTFLMDPANAQRCSRRFAGRDRYFWAMDYQGYFVWGATAGMLVNLRQFLRADSED